MVILVVDDDAYNRKVTKRLLESLGYQVKTANEGTEALEILQQNSIKILITDNDMPGMTGLRLIQIVQPQLPKLKIVLMSGHQLGHLPHGITFLQKPVSREKWEAILKEV